MQGWRPWWGPGDGSSRWKRETLKFLKVGSTFTWRTEYHMADYRVMQIVAPNEDLQVPGWITVWPVLEVEVEDIAKP